MMANQIEHDAALRRLRRALVLLPLAAAAGAGACWLYLTLEPHLPIRWQGCLMKRILHLYCPGCGGTRAVKALLAADIVTSLQANPVVLWMGILAVMQYVRMVRAYLRRDPYGCALPTWSWVSLIVLALTLFVVRNLLLVFGGYDYLGDNLAFWMERFG